MKRIALSLALTLGLAAPAAAQQLLTVYDTRLGPQDRVNSRGRPLSDLCAVIQQDRANFHRFGKRDVPDMSDPIFADRSMRAQIAGNCHLQPGFEYLRKSIFEGAGYGVIVRVRVFRTNGRLQLQISERAG